MTAAAADPAAAPSEASQAPAEPQVQVPPAPLLQCSSAAQAVRAFLGVQAERAALYSHLQAGFKAYAVSA